MRVIEFYSGIGGMHFALNESGVEFQIVSAMEINTTANEIYRHNFPDSTLSNTNIEGLTLADLDRLQADCFVMSPPCQPYTRQGNQAQSQDPRSRSYLNILNLIEQMANPPKYILIENVKGFESSDSRDLTVNVLKQRDYKIKEFLISPSQFSIPNSRSRYYMLARISSKEICDTPEQMITDMSTLPTVGLSYGQTRLISEYTDDLPEAENVYIVPEKVVSRFHKIFDIVYKDSNHSCCFTKAYGHYVEGTGSILSPVNSIEVQRVYDGTYDSAEEKATELLKLHLRYFSPMEIARLMCFPNSFSFPASMTRKQRYRALGNSVNVKVISTLMQILFNEQ